MSHFMLRKLDERETEADQSCKKKKKYLYSSSTSLDISSLFPFSSFYVPLFGAIINAGTTSVGLVRKIHTSLFYEHKKSFRLELRCSHVRCCTSCPQAAKCFITPADLKYLIPLSELIKGEGWVHCQCCCRSAESSSLLVMWLSRFCKVVWLFELFFNMILI